MLNPFETGFSLTSLTQAITSLPNQYGKIVQSGLFQWRPGLTPTIAVEMRGGVLSLVPTRAWGAPGNKNLSTKRSMKGFVIPHTPLEDLVLAQDIMGVRQFGSETAVETITGRVNDKLQEMKTKIDQTMEWRQMTALKGIVLDADGSTVIENVFTAFGVTQKVIDFDLDNSSSDVRGKCVELTRWMEDHLQGETMSVVHVLCSSEFFDALVNHANVKAVYQNWQAAQAVLGGDIRKGFVFGGVEFEEYRAIVDGQRFIDSGDGHAYPLGTTQGTFSNFGAPADFMETINSPALPYYARQKNTDYNRGVEIHVQANQLPLCLRPKLIVRIHA